MTVTINEGPVYQYPDGPEVQDGQNVGQGTAGVFEKKELTTSGRPILNFRRLEGELGISVSEDPATRSVKIASGVVGANTQASWFIDPATGNDTNSGETAAQSLATHEEFRRRIGTQTINTVMTVSLASNFPSSNPIIIDFQLGDAGKLLYVGTQTLTTLATGTFTATTAISPAANQAQEVTDAALAADWGPLGLVNTPSSSARRIRITAGPNTGAISWACSDLGVKTARTSPFGFPATTFTAPDPTTRQVSPSVGDAYVVESGFTFIERLIVDLKSPPFLPDGGFGIQVLFNDIEIDPGFLVRPLVKTFGARNAAPPVNFSGCAVGRLTLFAGVLGCDYCRLGGFFFNVRGGYLDLGACLVLASVAIRTSADTQFFGNTIFQGGRLAIDGILRASDLAGFDSFGEAILLQSGGRIITAPFIAAGAGVYGSGSFLGMTIRAGGQVSYDPSGPNAGASGMTITGGVGDFDIASTGVTAWVAVAPDLTVAGKLAGVSANT